MAPGIKVDTLIVSDVHIGAPISRARKLDELISRLKFKRLILLGDFFEDVSLNRFSKDNLALLSTLRRFASAKEGREIIWIRGNHDHKLADRMAGIVGGKVYDEYVWEYQGKRFLAIHGDSFDTTFSLRRFFLMDKLGHAVFILIQYADKEANHIVKLVERSYRALFSPSMKVANGAVAYAKTIDADHVFCGHTHEAMQMIFYGNGHDGADDGNGGNAAENNSQNKRHAQPVHYFNVGCWTRSPSTFAVIDESGAISLEEVK